MLADLSVRCFAAFSGLLGGEGILGHNEKRFFEPGYIGQSFTSDEVVNPPSEWAELPYCEEGEQINVGAGPSLLPVGLGYDGPL